MGKKVETILVRVVWKNLAMISVTFCAGDFSENDCKSSENGWKMVKRLEKTNIKENSFMFELISNTLDPVLLGIHTWHIRNLT